MLKPPHPAAAAAYLMAMSSTPTTTPSTAGGNGGPGARGGGRPRRHGPLPADSSGTYLERTIANLEALRRPRAEAGRRHRSRRGGPLHPTSGCAGCSACGPSGPADARGRMDLEALEHVLRTDTIGTAVLTAGTTGLGAVDPIDEALALRERYGVRLHVDAAYGGFHAIPAWSGSADVPAAPYRAIAECNSVVVDAHKHGLQPYGCGCVLFRDPAVGQLLPAQLAVHLLHLLRAPPRRDQPGMLPGGGRGRRAVDRSSSSSPSPTRGWARSSPPAGGRPHAWPA